LVSDQVNPSVRRGLRQTGKVYTVRRYASTVYAAVVCPSVRPSNCLSHKPALYEKKWLNARSCKQHHRGLLPRVFWRL